MKEAFNIRQRVNFGVNGVEPNKGIISERALSLPSKVGKVNRTYEKRFYSSFTLKLQLSFSYVFHTIYLMVICAHVQYIV